MSFSNHCKKLQSNGFQERFAEALRRRLAPNTTLTVQKFAHLIGASERTVWSWLGGGGVRGEALADAMKLFDDDFVNEVLDRPKLRPEREQRLQAIQQELTRILEERHD